MKKTEDVDEMNENWLETLWNEDIIEGVQWQTLLKDEQSKAEMVWTSNKKR